MLILNYISVCRSKLVSTLGQIPRDFPAAVFFSLWYLFFFFFEALTGNTSFHKGDSQRSNEKEREEY